MLSRKDIQIGAALASVIVACLVAITIIMSMLLSTDGSQDTVACEEIGHTFYTGSIYDCRLEDGTRCIISKGVDCDWQ